MTDEDRLADLLLRWEELHEQGRDVSAEELCRDCPHLAPDLARRINALKVTSWLSKPDEGGEPPHEPPGTDGSPPRTLAGRYRLDRRIAEGGFAEVWRAFDGELQRAVAVKLPKRGRVPSTERFIAEARRVARLKHPGVVPVFDVGRDGDTCFIVSEVVEGGSLAERIAQGRPTPQEAARLVAEVAETLAYAHRQGFIHRDIKPGNILIDHHGRALLADFGIARAPEDADSGIVSFGTLAYMSPEQVEGRHVDHRTDIYSLGVVLYELLAGQLPHQGADPVQLRREIVSGPPPLFPDPATVPSQLAEICMKCLARNPADRYQDAAKLAADLRKPARKSFPARRLLVGLASLLLIAAVAGLAVFFQQHTPTSDQPNEPATASKNDEAPSPAPGTVEAALALGKLHFNRKKWGEAETAFSEAIRLDPDCAEAYHLRAGSLFNVGKVKESLPDFDKAVALDPHNAELFKNRGIARLNLLHFDEALADLRHALELDPENPEPYRKVLGETFARRAFEHDRAKKWKEAVADMNEAIQHRPAFADYYDKRGSFHYNLGQFEEALKDFSEAIRLDPKQPAFFLHRGYAHQALGREDEAVEDFAKTQRAGGKPR